MQRSRFRTVAVLAVTAVLAGCRGPEPSATVSTAPPAAVPHDTGHAERVAALWSQHCAVCHANGEGGAPRLGNVAEWQPRVAQGKAVLLQHTLEGFNNMPPLGYCMSCELEDFEALIQFMAGNL